MADRASLPGDQPDTGARVDIFDERDDWADEPAPAEAEEEAAPTEAEEDPQAGPDEEIADAGEPEVATRPRPRPRGFRAAAADPRVAWAVALLAVAVAAATSFAWWELRSADQQTRAALEAGEIAALQLTTFSGSSIDEAVADMQALSTPDYRATIAEQFDPELRAALRDNEVESVGEILRSFVQEVEGTDATVFVIVRATSVNAARPEPVGDELRMEVSLRLVDGRWLVDDVAVLGPSTLGAAPPPGPESPATEEAQ